MRKHNEYLQQNHIYSDVSTSVAAWVPPPYRRWSSEHLKKGEPLKVFFMNGCPSHWRYKSDRIYRNLIMEVAQGNATWKNCFTVGVDVASSHIRVMFEGMCACEYYVYGGTSE